MKCQQNKMVQTEVEGVSNHSKYTGKRHEVKKLESQETHGQNFQIIQHASSLASIPMCELSMILLICIPENTRHIAIIDMKV